MDQIWFAEKNVTLITTDLKGTDVADIYADFKFSEDGKEIISCPAGHRPKSNVYDINTQKCKASFPILESYGYEMNAPRSGSSHYTFRKQGCMPITIPKAMSYRMEIVEDKDEGGFVVSYPDLPGCITCGETVESAVANALDAKKTWLEAALEEGVEIHEPDSLEDYSGQFKLRIPRSLHRSLAEHSQREGISMNQYCVYLLSRNDAVFSK